MKKVFSLTALVIFFALLIVACSNDSSVSGDTMLPLPPAHAQIEPYDDGTGLIKVTRYAPDGILEQGDYLNNFREGVYTEFHANGYVKTSCGYVRGKKQGQMLTLDDKGQIQERATYHNDVLNGPFFIYNRTRIKEKRNYVDGKLSGMLEKFYPNGTIMEVSNYFDGQLNGVARWYDQEGNLSIEYTYEDGQLVEEEE